MHIAMFWTQYTTALLGTLPMNISIGNNIFEAKNLKTSLPNKHQSLAYVENDSQSPTKCITDFFFNYPPLPLY